MVLFRKIDPRNEEKDIFKAWQEHGVFNTTRLLDSLESILEKNGKTK